MIGITPDRDAIHLIAAAGRSGQALARALRARNQPFIPIIRNPATWPGPETPRVTDLTQPKTLAQALHDATTIISTAHARHIPAILAAAPRAQKFIFLGSTRKYTQWPDDHGNGVLAGEHAFVASGRPGVILHPTMIYGATGENNVQRLAALLRRLPFIPLPAGGQALVQPIHQSDVTRSLLAAIDHSWATPETLVIAGPTPLAYAGFVRAIAKAANLRPPRIIPVPPALLRLAAPITRLPFLPRIGADEIRRLLEDKAFDIAPMRSKLCIDPIALAEGLALTFGAPACPSSTASPTSTTT